MENMEKVVYLDNAATTPCAPEALEMMVKALSGACGNPSSHYSIGYEAKEFVDTGRAQVAKAINASPAELFFTSCGSEADNWAVKGTAFTKARQNKKHLITSAFEHHAIMHSMAALERMGFEVTYIKPTAEGYIRPEDVEAAMKGMLDPIFEEQVTGHAVVRQTFKASGVGTIAGSYVLDGKITRGCKARITRAGAQIFEGPLASLKRFKDDVKEVNAGYECGLVFEGFNDLKEDDMIEVYIMVEVPR